ncbi:MAG: PP2C family protein-serine/threonine phosphatase [Propioniciclava sp.]
MSAMRTDIGRVRQLNEDSALVGERIWAVADGMGGHAAGDVASGLVIDALTEVDRHPVLRTPDLLAGIRRANEQIRDHGRRHAQARGLGTTVAGLALVDVGGADHWAVFNVGDSRVYRAEGSCFARATIDHSETEELVLEGVITAAEARTHRSRNIITRSLGMPGNLEVDIWVLPRTPEERFLICSDGLPGELDDAEIAEVFGLHPAPGPAAEALVQASLARGGRDNVTVIVVNVEGSVDEEPDPGANPRARGVS